MSKTKTIRLGLAGFGSPYGPFNSGRGGGLFHKAVSSFDGVVPAAICDISSASLACARKVFPKIKTFTDCGKMLAGASLDALLIGTPAPFHAEFSAKALKKTPMSFRRFPPCRALPGLIIYGRPRNAARLFTWPAPTRISGDFWIRPWI